MHIPSSSASRARCATSSLSKFSPSFSLCRTTSLSSSSSQSCVSFVNQRHRSLSFSSALRSLRCSSPRWSHGAEWRSPVSLRAPARITAPVLERFERKMATIGKVGGPDLKSFIQQFEGASKGDRPQEASDAKTGVRVMATANIMLVAPY